MEKKEIEGKFWAVMDEALKAAGANLEARAKDYLNEAVKIGAQEIGFFKGERLEGAIEYGSDSYQELIGEAAV